MADFKDFAETALWYHSMKIGGYRTQGRFPSGVQNRTLLGVFDMLNGADVVNADCLDIGTVDGITAFALKQRGAAHVVGTDRVSRPTFGYARDEIGLDVDYVAGLELSGMIDRFGKDRFDVIVCAGVIYHMLNPFTAFQICRQLLKPGGLLFMETAADYSNETASMTLNSESVLFDESSTYWLPSVSAVEGMMKLAGFDVLDRRKQRALKRFSVVGRAVAPDSIRGRTTLLQAMHRQGYVDNEFSSKDLINPTTARPGPAYVVSEGREDLSVAEETKISFTLHPTPDVDDHLPIIGQRHKWIRAADVP